ncbi:unnamed protein product [Amoebophrya sp. A120]|nr:unnamed protein product [Amoebophrya sp. A120]|eukprot:GSA120T00006459001.1
MAAASSTDADTSGWNIFYPNYCNSEKTVPEGRRLGKEHCVAHPTAPEMAEAGKQLQLRVALEMSKCYPRDWLVQGRVKVLLKKEDGSFCNPEIKTKRDFLKQVCKVIQKMKHRTDGANKNVGQDEVMLAVEKVSQMAGPSQPNKKKDDGKKKKKK